MASSEWSAPNTFRKGFDIADVAAGELFEFAWFYFLTGIDIVIR